MSVNTIHLHRSLPGRHRADYGSEALTADLRVRKGRAPESNGKHRAGTNSPRHQPTRDGRRDVSDIIENLHAARARGAQLEAPGANLREAYLAGADLRKANLAGADLVGADLVDANLRGANLTGTDLRGADLWGADLRGADMTDADLRRADLTDAKLTGTILLGANLAGVNW